MASDRKDDKYIRSCIEQGHPKENRAAALGPNSQRAPHDVSYVKMSFDIYNSCVHSTATFPIGTVSRTVPTCIDVFNRQSRQKLKISKSFKFQACTVDLFHA